MGLKGVEMCVNNGSIVNQNEVLKIGFYLFNLDRCGAFHYSALLLSFTEMLQVYNII